MESIAIMAAISIVTALFNHYATRKQQDREFEHQQQLLTQEQDFQSEREDILFQRNSTPEQFQQMIDSGFNPILAASSIMGGNGTAAASSDTSPSAPTTNSAIGALSNMIGQGGQNLYDMLRNNAEIENIQANTNKQEVETGLLPRDYMLRNLSVTKQLELWDKSIDKLKAETKMSKEQANLIKQQSMYYGRLSEAQINAYKAQVHEAVAHASLLYEQVDTERAKQTELYSQAGLNTQLQSESVQNVAESVIRGQTTFEQGELARIQKEFEQKLGGIPLTADAQRYVESLIKDGKMKEVEQFYNNIFATALNQAVGTSAGTYLGRPTQKVGLFGEYDFGVGKHTNFYAPYAAPYWNPQP